MSPLSRRAFLAAAAAAAGGLTACRTADPKPASTPGNRPRGDVLALAIIGAGGRGGNNLEGLAATGAVDVVAICDCDARQASAA